ncbi:MULTISPECIES: hypothetical protein [unclassified Cryobacterium]|uniref:hypothetical protein n=1 Tax=unclassified Cryobacterium TaxID=2649013 RepID=UPI00106BD485|nr:MULTISPECIES: hypothetical protein [unclassified Cryobacterium]TFC59408.1 hypothetical protein E3O68_00470 [Cryobacterium sp. TMB3-1-2]TFC67204.1 hypothetical protein E3T21_17165 [Cryobacterium sp. TMB3-15]TFC73283.1 hypothetical protein E3T22_16890 [Cryobacterium sp. TMB3-10]TFD46171.1 hypothetical protein E3T58_01525 [Cryobacterium sp. TMB3-12]
MSPDPIAPEVTLRRTLAQYIHDQDMGVYKPSAPYVAGERGIYTTGDMPVAAGSDNALVLRSLQSIADGRANMLYRVQIEYRIKGNGIAAENLGAGLDLILDQQEGVPPGLHISRCELFSFLPISADASGRTGGFKTYHFTGRRGL